MSKGRCNFNFAFLFFTVFLVLPLAAQERIPLLISEHHADHMEFFLRHGRNTTAAMIVLDAHTDTIKNEQSETIRRLAAAGNFSLAGELAGNHNWIHPLVSAPVEALAWISTLRGSPHNEKQNGFFNSVSTWEEKIRTVLLSVEELRFLEISGETLFVSIDLDFFYSEDYGPEDIPPVLNSLFAFSSRWSGPVVWAICLSRPWLPDDRYAWTLLDRSLQWLRSRPEFNAVEITLFNSSRIDTSRTAEALREQGQEMPALRETDAPEHIRTLIRELQERQ